MILRMVISFSDRHGLPVEMHLYRGDEETAAYRYSRMRLDPPADDEAFRLSADARLYAKYQEAR